MVKTSPDHAMEGFVVVLKGNWIAAKLFFGGDQGEVFLNLNPALGKAEFSIKDSDYGDYVIGELAKVL